MAHPWHHSLSSSRRFGGTPEDYLDIHSWFDGSKAQMADFRHRALRHHAFGIFEAESLFGRTLTNSDGRVIPVRFIGEQHVREDCGGRIPSVVDWLRGIPFRPWMNDADGEPHERARPPEGDLSVEAWRMAVALGETVLGHADWVTARTGGTPGDDAAADTRGSGELEAQGGVPKAGETESGP